MCENPNENNANSASDLNELFKGIAVFLDDEIDDKNSSAYQIRKQIEERGIPLIAKNKLPENMEDFASHLYGTSFIVLDWKFGNEINKENTFNGVSIPSGISEKSTLDFLSALLEKTYCPIFIFSQEDKNNILEKIENNFGKKHPRIFVESKNITGNNLFKTMSSWFFDSSIIYVLKTWESILRNAKYETFSALEKKSDIWPNFLGKMYKDDDENPSYAIIQTLNTIVSNRMYGKVNFNILKEDEINNLSTDSNSIKDLRGILEEERVIKISEDSIIGTGDIFKMKEGNDEYYLLNIRAQCDTIHCDNKDDIMLYCIKGKAIDESKIKDKGYSPLYGQFNEKIYHAIVPFIEDKIIEFNFKDLLTYQYKDIKLSRFARLLPPYINRIQQRYCLYFSRQGLPRTPSDLFKISKK